MNVGPHETRSPGRGKIPGPPSEEARPMAPGSPTTFKAVPAQDELADIPRDLSFHPSANPAPKVLTPEQVARFNRDGYLMPLRIFSEAEIADIRRYFDNLL